MTEIYTGNKLCLIVEEHYEYAFEFFFAAATLSLSLLWHIIELLVGIAHFFLFELKLQMLILQELKQCMFNIDDLIKLFHEYSPAVCVCVCVRHSVLA